MAARSTTASVGRMGIAAEGARDGSTDQAGAGSIARTWSRRCDLGARPGAKRTHRPGRYTARPYAQGRRRGRRTLHEMRDDAGTYHHRYGGRTAGEGGVQHLPRRPSLPRRAGRGARARAERERATPRGPAASLGGSLRRGPARQGPGDGAEVLAALLLRARPGDRAPVLRNGLGLHRSRREQDRGDLPQRGEVARPWEGLTEGSGSGFALRACRTDHPERLDRGHAPHGSITLYGFGSCSSAARPPRAMPRWRPWSCA